MGKAVGGLPEAPALSSDPAATRDKGSDSIGRYLERQRRLRGLSLEEVANLTKIPRRSLERLEAGAFDRDPDGFTRGFVRTVAAAIGLDPQATVERMLTEMKPQRLRAAQNLIPALVGLALLIAMAALAVAAANWLGTPGAPASETAEPELRRRDFGRELADRRAPADSANDFRLHAPGEELLRAFGEPGIEPDPAD
ncbi:MAG: helix-turn-helix domain-containing protein [Myxococcota bacterium]